MTASEGASPSLRLDGKTSRNVAEITERFKYQPLPNACYPNCIFNVLSELSLVHKRPEIKLSESKINALTLYRSPSGPVLAVVVRNLNKELQKYGYRAFERSRSTYSNLAAVVSDLDCSYPIMGLAYSYLLDEVHAFKVPEAENDRPDHTVIVLSCNENNMIIYDPFEGISSAMRRKQQGLGKGVVELATSRMLEYWQSALENSWMFWIKKETPKSKPLETYLGQAGADS